MTTVFLFPGQGSQFIGMGKELHDTFTEAKETFQEVDDALSQNLSKLMFEGDESDLTMTSNTQPAIMTVSMAVMKILEKQSGKTISDLCSYAAGHSLGEYSALCAARTFSLADTAKLLRIRGDAMQNAVPVGKGAMVALLGATEESANQISQEVAGTGICQIANDNGAGQIVMSGEAAAIDMAVEVASNFGIKRAVKLPVSAPFHSELMQPAADTMKDALAKVEANAPQIPIIANVSAKETTDSEEIKSQLVEQVTGKVRWRETMEFFLDNNIEHFVEIGPGKVLSTIAKRMNRNAQISSIHTPDDIEKFLSN